MLEFTFSETLSGRLNRAAAAAVDFTPAMRAIADYMREATLENFKDERGPDGQKWRPSRRALEDGGLTLTDRGDLRLSITAASDANTALAGTNLVYAAIHQFGGTIRPRGAANGGRRALRTPFGPRGAVQMPARPFLGFGPADVAEIEAILTDHLDQALEAGA
jgi:phage virion morphogenesis protein